MTIAPPPTPKTPCTPLLIPNEIGSPTFSEISLGSPLSPTSRNSIKEFKWLGESDIRYEGSVVKVDIIQLIFRTAEARAAYIDRLNKMSVLKVEKLLTPNPHKETSACVKITTLTNLTERLMVELQKIFPSFFGPPEIIV